MKNQEKRQKDLSLFGLNNLDTERIGQRRPTDRADVFGQNVQLKTVVPGGGVRTVRTKTFSADMGVQFCISADGNQECFCGMDVKGELMKKLQNYGSMYGNNSYFYKLIHKEKGIMLFRAVVYVD